MNKILQVSEYAKLKIQEYGLKDWYFRFNNAKTRIGVCNYRKKEINISLHFLDIDINKLYNAILHEIAHALVGFGNGHNEIWKKKAIEIGCDGERCVNLELEDLKYKYHIYCGCGANNFYRHVVKKRTQEGKCLKCNEKLIVKNLY